MPPLLGRTPTHIPTQRKTMATIPTRARIQSIHGTRCAVLGSQYPCIPAVVYLPPRGPAPRRAWACPRSAQRVHHDASSHPEPCVEHRSLERPWQKAVRLGCVRLHTADERRDSVSRVQWSAAEAERRYRRGREGVRVARSSTCANAGRYLDSVRRSQAPTQNSIEP